MLSGRLLKKEEVGEVDYKGNVYVEDRVHIEGWVGVEVETWVCMLVESW
jgi:hypothetical protein